MRTLKVFYSFVTRRKFVFASFLVATVLVSVLYGIIPYFYKLFADNLEAQNFDALIPILVIFVCLRFAALFLGNLSFFLGDAVTFDGAINARIKIFKHIQDLDFAFHSSKSIGSLISVTKRGEGAFWGLFQAIHHRFLDVIVRFFVMAYFFTQVDFRITIYAFVSMVIALMVTKFLVDINIKARMRHNYEEDKVSAIITDNLVNFETVKLFSKENWEQNRLKDNLKDWLKYGWKYVNTFRLIDASVGSLINISTFIVLLFIVNEAQNLRLGVGDFLLIFGFVNSFYPQLFELVYSFREVTKSYADIEKYFEILDNEVEVKDPAKPVSLPKVVGEVIFNNVSFSYDSVERGSESNLGNKSKAVVPSSVKGDFAVNRHGGRHKDGKKNAVKNINLSIKPGESIALVGRSGSGKTTLVKLLLRFYDVDAGSITLDGVDIREFRKSDLRGFTGVVPQEPVLFNNTISYNIGYGAESGTQKEIIEAARLANLHKFIKSLRKGYETNVGERGIKLSGGQKQRLAIARMILSDPKIIIFDEATSQLDSENEKLIQDAFWKAAKAKTTIIIAHRLSTALRADKIVVMENGQIVEVGSHSTLLKKEKSLYKYFWGLQTAAS